MTGFRNKSFRTLRMQRSLARSMLSRDNDPRRLRRVEALRIGTDVLETATTPHQQVASKIMPMTTFPAPHVRHPARRVTGSLPGHNPLDVLDLMAARLGGSADDGRRLALVVEGGAMRGVYAAGTLLALHLLGHRDTFDDLFGSSGGAVSGAHFLSGLGHAKAATYYRWLDGSKFIKPLRLGKIVDIDYLADDVLTRLDPVEVERVNESRTTLWVAMLNEQTAEIEIRDPRRDGIPLLSALKAAVALPVLYRRTVVIGSEAYLDAGCVQPYPLQAAIAAGCTDILVVSARPASYRSKPLRWWTRRRPQPECRARQRADFVRSSRRARNSRMPSASVAEGTVPPGADVNIATLAPAVSRIGKITTNANLLRSEMIGMCRHVLGVFGAPDDELLQLIAEDVV